MAGIGDPPANSDKDATRIVPSRPSGSMPPAAASGQTAAGHGGSLLRPGQLLAHTYEIEALIGRGGMGEVYRARHVDVRSLHAIKMILPSLANDPQIVGMFTEEARKLRMVRHDAVVAYDGMFRDEDHLPYLVMEFVDGVALGKVMGDHKLTPIEVRHLRDRLAQGLAAAHDKQIFHRDISPDNIILVDGKVEQAKIIDFGIAKAAGADERTVVGTGFAGKYSYVSPEQLGEFGGQVDARTDIYSLGLMLAAAAIGRPLDMGHTPASAVAARKTIPDLTALPAELRDEIAPLLEPDPANRPRSMRDLPGSFIGGDSMISAPPHTTAAPTKSAPTKSAPRRSVAPMAAVAAIVILALAGGGGYVLFKPAPHPESAAPTPSQPISPSPGPAATAANNPPSPPPTSDKPVVTEAMATANPLPASITPAAPQEVKPAAIDTVAAAPPPAKSLPTPADSNPAHVAVVTPPGSPTSSLDRDALLARVTAIAGTFSCAVLKPVLSDANDLRIAGFVSTAGDQARLAQALGQLRDGHGNAANVTVYNWPQCQAALDTLRQSGAIADGMKPPRLEFNKPVLDYREGDPFIIEATASGGFDSYLYIDLLDNTGRVYHLHASAMAMAAGKLLRVGTENPKAKNYMDIGPPFGPALVLAIAAPRPLFARPRPADEDGGVYLAALGEALRDTGGRAVASYRLIDTAPR
ncbi:MAG TPA: protein kinase [Stellaceae bacterium]|nr:protein kinase [Stellaceae bacterium]